jgi:hypothetical protein
MPAQNPLAPAQLFMRAIPEYLGNFPLTLGGSAIKVPLDQTGYLDSLIVHVKGTVTVATAALVFAAGMPWNLITQFLVQPPGQTPPFRLGGQSLHGWNLIAPDFAPFAKAFGSSAGEIAAAYIGTPATTSIDAPDLSSVDQFGVDVGAGAIVHLWYVLPFHRSSMDMRGTVPLGNKTRTNLVMSVAAAADVVTVAANLTVPALSVDVYQVNYTPPAADSGAMVDPYWAVTYDESEQASPTASKASVEILPDDTILGVLHQVITDGQLDSGAIDTLALRVNQSWFLGDQGFPFEGWDYIQRRQHAQLLPKGLIVYDLDAFVDDGLLDVRAWLHTDRVNTIESFITRKAGSTIIAGDRIVTSVRRLVDLNPAAHVAALG